MNKKYYLKFGLYFAVVTTLISLIGQILWKPISLVSLPGLIILAVIDELFLGGNLKNPTFTGTTSFIFSLLLSSVVYFIVGSIIGSIYGKIKTFKNI